MRLDLGAQEKEIKSEKTYRIEKKKKKTIDGFTSLVHLQCFVPVTRWTPFEFSLQKTYSKSRHLVVNQPPASVYST